MRKCSLFYKLKIVFIIIPIIKIISYQIFSILNFYFTNITLFKFFSV